MKGIIFFNKEFSGAFGAVQWLRIHPSNAGGAGSIPGWGTKIPHATCCGLPTPILVHNKVFSVSWHFLSETKQTKNIPEDEK